MLSPVKLLKADLKTAKPPVTMGSHGKPYAYNKGTPCYRHCIVDHSLHRLLPAMAERSKTVKKLIAKPINIMLEGKESSKTEGVSNSLLNSSPRWGERNAPSHKGGKTVPLPKKGEVEVSKSTYAAAGAGAAGVGVHHHFHHKNHKA